MRWLWHLIGRTDDRPMTDRETFRRREAQLKERYERLERLAIEADVISRTDRPEERRPWPDR